MSEAFRSDGSRCPCCGEGVLRRAAREQQYEYRGERLGYLQPGDWCDRCSEGVLNGADMMATEPLLQQFMADVDRRQAAELARIRKRLRLSQRQAAALAGGSRNAFSRYERGEAKPQQAVVNLFRLLDRHPELLRELQPPG